MAFIGDFFGWIMSICYSVVHNYGLTILLFTFITKVILMPISIIVQKNSIKMVKMYPEMNRIRARCFGNKNLISEEQYHLYKREKYNPMMDLVPVIAQLIILMGVIHAFSEEALQQLSGLEMEFLGLHLGKVPIQNGGTLILIPVFAALSAWFMCYIQNKINVLQSEQGKVNQTVTLLVSVGLSLYLGFFVPAGVGFYWIVSNLLSVVITVLLNRWIDPRKFIDYEELEASKQELNTIRQYARQGNKRSKGIYADKEKTDYKRFLKYGSKQIVFYSEKSGFYKYFQSVIEVILRKTDIVIHYITSDPEDAVFALAGENFQVYYIGENKLIVLMMKMDADMVVMTTPDLQKYHLKRSMIREDIEYVYIDHGIGSVNMMLRKHALDHFDTVFVANDIAYQEIREQEKQYHLKEKNIVKCGFGLIDKMIADYSHSPQSPHDTPQILIAPSWQKDNLLDLCIDEVLKQLLNRGYHVILRPHPQYVRHFEEKLMVLQEKYASCSTFQLQMDFSSNETVFQADVLITDWSGIGYEYSFTTLKPTLFINTPMKVMNPDYQEIGVEPFDIIIRDKVGISVDMKDIHTVGDTVHRLLTDESWSRETMAGIREEFLYNTGCSGQVGADYIIGRLIEYSRQ